MVRPCQPGTLSWSQNSRGWDKKKSTQVAQETYNPVLGRRVPHRPLEMIGIVVSAYPSQICLFTVSKMPKYTIFAISKVTSKINKSIWVCLKKRAVILGKYNTRKNFLQQLDTIISANLLHSVSKLLEVVVFCSLGPKSMHQ